jgi:hypothetical protein
MVRITAADLTPRMTSATFRPNGYVAKTAHCGDGHHGPPIG